LNKQVGKLFGTRDDDCSAVDDLKVVDFVFDVEIDDVEQFSLMPRSVLFFGLLDLVI
jgi:hypothetical protein